MLIWRDGQIVGCELFISRRDTPTLLDVVENRSITFRALSLVAPVSSSLFLGRSRPRMCCGMTCPMPRPRARAHVVTAGRCGRFLMLDQPVERALSLADDAAHCILKQDRLSAPLTFRSFRARCIRASKVSARLVLKRAISIRHHNGWARRQLDQ